VRYNELQQIIFEKEEAREAYSKAAHHSLARKKLNKKT
jgi:hypothetical protein